MEKLHQEFSNNGLLILAINFRETPEQVKAFVKTRKLTFITLLDPDGSVFELYQAWAMGARDWDSKEARGFFRQLVAGGKS